MTVSREDMLAAVRATLYRAEHLAAAGQSLGTIGTVATWRAIKALVEASEWRDIAAAPKLPIDDAGYGPLILLRCGDFVIADQWKPSLPEYPLQSHWRKWPYHGSGHKAPTHWKPLDTPPSAEPAP